jgi:pimeloyl-ACP methyl ester carboxylesterase
MVVLRSLRPCIVVNDLGQNRYANGPARFMGKRRMVSQVGNRAAPGAGFVEQHVDAGGFRIRYLEAGDGAPLVYLHGAGGLQLSYAHDLLADQFRVCAFEMPGFGNSPENMRTASMPDLAATMALAVANLGIESFNLVGTSFGGAVAAWLACQQPERVSALVLESPAAIRIESSMPPPQSLEELASRLYAHPERQWPHAPIDPAIRAKGRALVDRVRGPNRDPELESRLHELPTPTLVLFGTLDRMIPPETGRIYAELMPNCNLMFVYDAAHEIGADRPEAFAEAVCDFLQRHEAFIISRTDTLILP